MGPFTALGAAKQYATGGSHSISGNTDYWRQYQQPESKRQRAYGGYSASYGGRLGGSGLMSGQGRPNGMLNLGNTCYMNATLQVGCLEYCSETVQQLDLYLSITPCYTRQRVRGVSICSGCVR